MLIPPAMPNLVCMWSAFELALANEPVKISTPAPRVLLDNLDPPIPADIQLPLPSLDQS